jgi:hypothetical protein
MCADLQNVNQNNVVGGVFVCEEIYRAFAFADFVGIRILLIVLDCV